jgi:hypothetical protein
VVIGRKNRWSRFIGSNSENESEEEMLDVQKRERSGGSKSEATTEMEAVVIETIERTAENLRHKKGQNWISM